ncbi:MAG: ATP-binding cassette domain-containing protein [Myxococcota bacterium]|jgi:ATP-binding cassette subfamily F protein 3|nr:ATP-binding cassette domain-containing protein [Myxococcota bacterium]
MLLIQNITYAVGGRTLFESATAHVPAGHRVGFVGPNGSGKTTLFRLILGHSALDGGEIRVRSDAQLGIVAQEAPGGEATPLETVLAADSERTSLLAESETATCASRIAEIHERLVHIDAHSAPARAAQILAGLGFDEAAQARPLRTFSGGWRMRVALAVTLLCEPDLLLLDEPTNHLDLEATLWLTDHLRAYPKTLLVISHDRSLLNDVSQSILHLDEGKLEMYSGGYDSFQRIRAMRRAHQQVQAERQEAERARLQAFVDRFKAKATKAKQAQSRVKLLEKMVPISVMRGGRRVEFDFPRPVETASPLIKLEGMDVGYVRGQPVLCDVNLSVYADDRIALLGANGNGKTTLARLIAGHLRQEKGDVVRSSKLNVGYFAQDHLDQLQAERTALEHIARYMPSAPQAELRAFLGRFGLSQGKAEVPAASLSGGEKTRLSFALLGLKKPNLLILDEPTNHLDVQSREALMEGLNEYEGAVILVSHDRHLIEATTEQLWLVQEGCAKQFFGDLDEYVALLLERRKARRAEEAGRTEGSERADRKQVRRDKAELRKRLAPLKIAAHKAEEVLSALGSRKAEVDAELSDPKVYSGPAHLLAQLARQQRKLEAEIEQAEEAWLEAHGAYEEALAEEQADS